MKIRNEERKKKKKNNTAGSEYKNSQTNSLCKDWPSSDALYEQTTNYTLQEGERKEGNSVTTLLYQSRVPFRAMVSPSLTETHPLIPLARLPWRVSSERTRNLSSHTPRFESTHLASIRPFSRFKFTRWGRQSREFDGERPIELRRTGNTAFRMFYFVV